MEQARIEKMERRVKGYFVSAKYKHMIMERFHQEIEEKINEGIREQILAKRDKTQDSVIKKLKRRREGIDDASSPFRQSVVTMYA